MYFVTPTELRSEATPPDRFLRVGGMVLPGSLEKDLDRRKFRFRISDGQQSIAVHFQGVPPDLFSEGKGAVVEGRLPPGRRLSSLDGHGQACRGVQPAPGRRRPRKATEFRARAAHGRLVTATLGHSWRPAGAGAGDLGDRGAHPARAHRQPGLLRLRPLRHRRPVRARDRCRGSVDLRPGGDRFLHPLRRLQHHPQDPGLLPRHRTVGRPRRVAAALGVDPHHLLGPGGMALPQAHAGVHALGADGVRDRFGPSSWRSSPLPRIPSRPCSPCPSTAGGSTRCWKTPTC